MKKLQMAGMAMAFSFGMAACLLPTAGAKAQELAKATETYQNVGGVAAVNVLTEEATMKEAGYVALERKDTSDPKITDFFEVSQGENVDFSSLASTADTYIVYCSTDVYTTAMTEAASDKTKKTIALGLCKKITLKSAPKKMTAVLNYSSFKAGDPMIKEMVSQNVSYETWTYAQAQTTPTTTTAQGPGVMYKIGERGVWSDAKNATTAVLKSASKTGSTIYYTYLSSSPNAVSGEVIRATKVAKVRVSKKAKAPTVAVDYARGLLKIKTGMAYTTNPGDDSSWKVVGKVNGKAITSVSPYEVLGLPVGSTITNKVVYVCTAGTDRKPSSGITKITLNSARTLNSVAFSKYDMSTKDATKIATGSSAGVYLTVDGVQGDMEYLVPESGKTYYSGNAATIANDTASIADARWTSFKSGKAIPYKDIANAKNANGLTFNDLKDRVVYVREKGYKDKATGAIYLSGPVWQLTFSNDGKSCTVKRVAQ